MLGAPIPPELHDAEPPRATGERRRAVDAASDRALRDALAAAFA
jgi:hypothetical protein